MVVDAWNTDVLTYERLDLLWYVHRIYCNVTK